MHVDPLSQAASNLEPIASQNDQISDPVHDLGITTIEQLKEYLQAGGSLTPDQKQHIVASIQARMAEEEAAQSAVEQEATTQQSAAIEEINQIDCAEELQLNGLKNLALLQGETFKRLDPETITIEFAQQNLRHMAFITPDGVAKPISKEAAERLPPLGSTVQVENLDGSIDTIRIRLHLAPMSDDEFEEFQTKFLSHIAWHIQNRIKPPEDSEKQKSVHEPLLRSTFVPVQIPQAKKSQPIPEFFVEVVGSVRKEENRRIDRAEQQDRNNEIQNEKRERVHHRRIHLEGVEDERREDIKREEKGN